MMAEQITKYDIIVLYAVAIVLIAGGNLVLANGLDEIMLALKAMK